MEHKKLLITTTVCLALSVFSVCTKAQTNLYKAFKLDMGIGYAMPSYGTVSGTKLGGTFTLQPHYRIGNRLSIGFRAEVAGLGNDENGNSLISAVFSGSPTLECYLTKSGFRPLLGFGYGQFRQAYFDTDSHTFGSVNFSKTGYFPYAGFEAGGLRITAEDNKVGNNSDYIAFKLGFFFGGGRKK